jgi:hypothetical protein
VCLAKPPLLTNAVRDFRHLAGFARLALCCPLSRLAQGAETREAEGCGDTFPPSEQIKNKELEAPSFGMGPLAFME